MSAKKNRTGSEGGEKARYPSPVVGKNKLLRRKMPKSVGLIKGKFSPNLLMLY